MKVSIKEASIDCARKRRRELCRDRVILTNRLICLRQRLVDGDESVQPFVIDAESSLKSLYIREFEGVKIRSRAKWLEEGERTTRYYAREKSLWLKLQMLSKVSTPASRRALMVFKLNFK